MQTSLSGKELEIESTFKHNYNAMRDRYGTWFIPKEEEIALSNWYKDEHQILIDERHRQDAAAERAENAVERDCRDCNGTIEPHQGRGRPPVRCESCRAKASV